MPEHTMSTEMHLRIGTIQSFASCQTMCKYKRRILLNGDAAFSYTDSDVSLDFCGDPPHDELHTGDRHTVAQRFISGRVRCTGDICPSIRKALQTFTLQRSQAANEIGIGFCLLANEIGGVLVLTGTLRADHTILTEVIHALATIDRMMI